MHIVTATEAKNRLGECLKKARQEPVCIESHGVPVGYIVSPDQFLTMTEGHSCKLMAGFGRHLILHPEDIEDDSLLPGFEEYVP